jgi:hypothetical protein
LTRHAAAARHRAMDLKTALEVACPPGDTSNPHADRPNFTLADFFQMCRDGEAKLSISEAARVLGISRVTLHRWIVLASVSDEEFEAVLAEFPTKGKRLSTTAVADEIRRCTGTAKAQHECCPNCGYVLRTRVR